jgi:hypothetical protein
MDRQEDACRPAIPDAKQIVIMVTKTADGNPSRRLHVDSFAEFGEAA